jgi:hypothetical protein
MGLSQAIVAGGNSGQVKKVIKYLLIWRYEITKEND